MDGCCIADIWHQKIVDCEISWTWLNLLLVSVNLLSRTSFLQLLSANVVVLLLTTPALQVPAHRTPWWLSVHRSEWYSRQMETQQLVLTTLGISLPIPNLSRDAKCVRATSEWSALNVDAICVLLKTKTVSFGFIRHMSHCQPIFSWDKTVFI